MLLRIRVLVFLTGDSTMPVFERIVDYDSIVQVKYESLVDSLKFLFGNSSKVVLEL